MYPRQRFTLRRLLQAFAVLNLLIVIPAAVYEQLDGKIELYPILVVAFGVLILLIAFGFAFGQSLENRARRSARRQLADTLIVWALASTAVGLAVTHDTNERQQRIWFGIAVATLLVESLYRYIANRRLEP